jgi:hypothetical protein
MTATAVAATTEALRGVIEQALGANQLYIGPPIAAEVGAQRASLLLFHVQPNAELRNEPYFSAPPATGPAIATPGERNALPLDLRYLITVFRTTGLGNAADPNELVTLGQIVQALHANPTLTGARLTDQLVRVTPEPYPMEELSRVWGLFPQDHYRTSMVYLASPVFVEAGAFIAGPPVQTRDQRFGASTEPPDPLRSREHREDEEEAA